MWCGVPELDRGPSPHLVGGLATVAIPLRFCGANRQLPMRARSSTGWVAGRPDTTAGSQPISIIDRPTSDPPRTASLTSESLAPVPDAETLPLFTNLFPLPPVNPCQHPSSLPLAAPAPSPEHNHARYDTLNRLQTLSPPSAFSGSGSFGFSYDALSRRTAKPTSPPATTTSPPSKKSSTS